MDNEEAQDSVNTRVASLEEANEEVERLLREVLDAESGTSKGASASHASRASKPNPAFVRESGRDLNVPDVLGEPSQLEPPPDGVAERERPISPEEIMAAQERVERLHTGTGTLSAQRRKLEEKESGFFASVGAAVLRALHME